MFGMDGCIRPGQQRGVSRVRGIVADRIQRPQDHMMRVSQRQQLRAPRLRESTYKGSSFLGIRRIEGQRGESFNVPVLRRLLFLGNGGRHFIHFHGLLVTLGLDVSTCCLVG